jgi:hypothetical protein
MPVSYQTLAAMPGTEPVPLPVAMPAFSRPHRLTSGPARAAAMATTCVGEPMLQMRLAAQVRGRPETMWLFRETWNAAEAWSLASE